MDFNGHDSWKTTDTTPDGPGLKYRCLDCAWTGRTGIAAALHHRSDVDHHQIALVGIDQPVYFSCCPCEDEEGDDPSPEFCPHCGLPNVAVNPEQGEASCICDMDE